MYKRLMPKVFFLGIVLLLMVIFLGYNYVQAEEPVRVMAAASLTEVFTELAQTFTEKTGIIVECNFAGSQALYSQIKLGVNADIFASANIKYMNQLEEAEMVIEPAIFAKNKLIIAVSKASDKIAKIADLTAGDIKIVIADESVPVGGYTIKMLTKENSNPDLGENFKAEFMENVVSKELDVKSVVNKVYLGEADAGVVYQTDLTPTTKKKVTMLKIADKYNIIASYPIALLRSSQNKKAAQQFIDYIYSDEGSNILVKYGFSRPGMDSD